MLPMLIAFAAAFGLLIGSFLNVVAYRVPLGASVAGGRSECPSCHHQIRAYDNVPVLSWLLLRGHCRDCQAPISRRYPVVEATTAVLWALVAAVAGDTVDVVLGIVLVTALVPITLIDLDHQRIPNVITYPAAATALVAGTAIDPGGELSRVLAGAGAALFLLVPVMVYPSGMGMGDVKLAAVLGLCLGPAVAVAILAALVVGSLTGVLLAARHGVQKARKMRIPFGPYLAVGGVVGIVAGQPLLDAYLSTF
ncbi:Leader peptidase (Prepilin peptidase) [Patulibacter medicamentivorans]|uniref:Leader peptidase (Prepilin peptidase) n=1 Tax=Patulibacter medicamentivorans TaxID=1097667 RepID=H0EC51_9ACTN|nr:A24 family peptidase [Patulibacter medicamentivorans]EHN08744.1 Leader peptidase (Prepilin peptidase) [Patulibacter medicamentivorans]